MFEVTKPMKFTGNFTIVVTPNDVVAEEEILPEESGAATVATEPEDEFGMTGDSRGFFSDSATVHLDASIGEITPEGYLKIPNVTIARTMVQVYEDSKGKAKRVLKAADALRDMIEFGSGRPVTDEHPNGGVVMSKKDTRGFIDNLYFTDAGEVKSDIYITCPRLKKTVQDGKKSEVSIGFYSNVNSTPGIFNDEEYDEVQTDIWLDHLAIVKNGRCSRKDGCGITDSVKPKVKIVKIKEKVIPAAVADSAATVAEKTKLINEIHLVTDSDVLTADLMKMSVSQLKLVKDMVSVPKGTAVRIKDSKPIEHVDDVCARLFE